jgi:hypothetical protein
VLQVEGARRRSPIMTRGTAQYSTANALLGRSSHSTMSRFEWKNALESKLLKIQKKSLHFENEEKAER